MQANLLINMKETMKETCVQAVQIYYVKKACMQGNLLINMKEACVQAIQINNMQKGWMHAHQHDDSIYVIRFHHTCTQQKERLHALLRQVHLLVAPAENHRDWGIAITTEHVLNIASRPSDDIVPVYIDQKISSVHIQSVHETRPALDCHQ